MERGPEIVDAALQDPRQQQTYVTIRALIRELRTLRNDADCYAFQRVLYSYLIDAEEAQAEASRNVKRLRNRKPVPASQSGNWEIDLLVADRIVRQLRSVGDALAWRVFGFDRRLLLAYSRNDPTGPMYGKAGLESEIREIMHVWKEERCFALLHGVTSALRVADLTKFTKAGPRIVETKVGRRKIPSAQ
jgi:hypothetical protein